MDDRSIPTRRAFLKGGAILAAPLAIAVPAAAMASDDKAVRLQRLEDEAAIRALHRDWLGRVNAGEPAADLFVRADAAHCLDSAVCALTADPASPDMIEIAGDGSHATGQFRCTVETQSRLAPHNIFAQMALAQGGGITRTSQQQLVIAGYVKADDRWLIATVEMRAA